MRERIAINLVGVEMRTEKAEIVAYVIIAVGLLLLVLTFIMAYLVLSSVGSIITSSLNISEALGTIFGPITEAVIKVMLLGIMGWTGSIATMRGIQLYKEAKAKPVSPPLPPPPLKPQQIQPLPAPQPSQQAQQPKPEEKKS